MNEQKRCMIFLLAAVLAGVLPIGGCGSATAYQWSPAESGTDTELESELSEPEEEPDLQTEVPLPEPETIWVYVCGAVQSPGVYELPAESRVFEALEAAGGTRKDAELRLLNQAAFLTDGEQITVLTAEEVETAGGVPAAGAEKEEAGALSGKVNLNTAGREELMTLSGIGEARAAAIIAYREAHGPFSSPEEIMNIEGIKEKAFSKIKEEIEV